MLAGVTVGVQSSASSSSSGTSTPSAAAACAKAEHAFNNLSPISCGRLVVNMLNHICTIKHCEHWGSANAMATKFSLPNDLMSQNSLYPQRKGWH